MKKRSRTDKHSIEQLKRQTNRFFKMCLCI